MPDISNPNLCGADAGVNKLLNQFDAIKSEVTAGLDTAASELAAKLDTGLTQLKSDLRALVPELPSLPSTNLQAEIKSLQGLVPGTPEFINLSAKLQTEFGPALKSAGQDLTDIISAAVPAISGALGAAEAALESAIGAATDAAGALGGLAAGSPDICKLAPNLELPVGAAAPLEKAAAVLQATAVGLAEDASKISENPNVKAATEKIVAKVTAYAVTSTPPTVDSGAYKIVESSVEVPTENQDMNEDGEEDTTTTAKTTVPGKEPPNYIHTAQKKAAEAAGYTGNVAKGGFQNRAQSLNFPIPLDGFKPHPAGKKSGTNIFSDKVANNKPLLVYPLPAIPWNIPSVIALRHYETDEGSIEYDSRRLTSFKGSKWSKTLKQDEFYDLFTITNIGGEPHICRTDYTDWNGYPAGNPGKKRSGASGWTEYLVGVQMVIIYITFSNYDPSVAIPHK